nr:hypothetical protein JVH1_8453 [Rhodococcus sp. JVH1]
MGVDGDLSPACSGEQLCGGTAGTVTRSVRVNGGGSNW